MSYDLSPLEHPSGTPRHVWIGETSSTGGDWVGTIRFAKEMKPDLQVREHLARLLGSDRVKELKIVVGTDEMWKKYPVYAQPPAPLPADA